MDLSAYCPDKVVTAQEAVSHIKRGSRVLVGSGLGEPVHLIEGMLSNDNIGDILENEEQRSNRCLKKRMTS